VPGRNVASAKRMAGLPLLAVCLTGWSWARPAKDVLVMKNGDRLTCEVKSLQAGVLKVNLDYVDGTISVDWRTVARVESNYLFIVTLQDGSLYSARLISPETVGENAIMLEVQDEHTKESHLVDKSQVVRIAQTSDTFLQRLSGSIAVGATYSKGNNATQYNFGSDLMYQRTRWGVGARYNSNLTSNTGAATSTRNQVDLGAYRMLGWTNYFAGGLATFLQSSVQGIHLQSSVGFGLGRYFKNTNRFRFWLLTGAGWQGTNYATAVVNEPPQNVGVAVISSSLQAFAFKKTRLDLTSTLYPALTAQRGRLFYKTNATYYLKLFGKVDWNLSFYGSWDTQPPPQFPGSDYGSSTGLSWTFGNK